MVVIEDDVEFEPEESFLLKLISPVGPAGVGAKLGEPATATVTISNNEDGKCQKSFTIEMISVNF